MIIVDINVYRDGGTIGIWMRDLGKFREKYESYLPNKITPDPTITIDRAIGTDTPGEWFFGWKKYGNNMIKDPEFKQEVLSHLIQKIENLQRMTDGVSESKLD